MLEESGGGKILVFANPLACGGLAKNALIAYLEYLFAQNIRYVKHITLPKNNQEPVAELFSKNTIKAVSIIGGDGTINLAINCLPNLDVPIHVIPAGTGNDLAKMIYENPDLRDSFSIIKNLQNIKNIDSWTCNGRRFSNGFGAGFDGEVAHRMYGKTYWLGPKVKYWIEILKLIFTYRSKKVEINGNLKTCFMLAAANGKVYGGGFHVAPTAKIDDQLLDSIFISKVPVWKRFLYLPKIEKPRG